jgi:hypothetical protein
MRTAFPNRSPFRILDIHVSAPEEPATATQTDQTPVETDVG